MTAALSKSKAGGVPHETLAPKEVFQRRHASENLFPMYSKHFKVFKKKWGKIKILFIQTQRNKSMELHFKGKRWLSLWIFIARATEKVNKP